MAGRSGLHGLGAGKVKPANTLHCEHRYCAPKAASEGLSVALVLLFLLAGDILSGCLRAPFGGLGAKASALRGQRQRAGREAAFVARIKYLVDASRVRHRAVYRDFGKGHEVLKA